MTIRRAVPDDAAGIHRLHMAAIRERCTSHYSREQIETWTAGLAPERYLAAIEKFEFFVAEEDRLLGFVILDLDGGELNAIYVDPRSAGRGVGKRLLRFGEELAVEAGLASLVLKSTLNAVGFYESRGYARLRETEHCHPSGVDLICVEMTKSLQAESHEAGDGPARKPEDEVNVVSRRS